MNNYLICICDDILRNVNMITAHIKSLKSKYPFLSDPKELKFKDVLEENLLQTVLPDLLILDLYDKDTDDWAGKSCLELIRANGLNIPTILYYGDKDGAELYDNFTQNFPFVIAEVAKKKDRVSGLLAIVEGELLKRLPSQFKLRYENDLIIQSQVFAIGESKLNQICKFIRDKYEMSEPIEFERMVSGYSGAFLFKFKHNNTDYILKASTETSKLLLEYQNAKNLYHKFPFFNYIDSDVFKIPDEGAAAIIIKLIENGKPLFNFIQEKSNFTEIENLLKELFLDDYSLKKHYRENKGDRISWTRIFEKFTGLRFAIVEDVIKELHPIIASFNFKSNSIKNLLLYQSFENLDKNKLFNDNVSVLCHGDLHSKNILIQGTRPLLIDTGGIKYDYWCMDICRLIVDLFIKGLDYETIDFYDIHKVDENVDIAKALFLRQPIRLNGNNENFIKSINWLTENCSEIYGDLYNPLEFQFGLIKEFLQVSTRVETIPANKRAIALLAAYEGMLLANESQNVS